MEGACNQHLIPLLSALGFRDPEEKCIYGWVSMARVSILDSLDTERAVPGVTERKTVMVR